MASLSGQATLTRIAFSTSRFAEFCSKHELIAQTGHPVEDWPLVIIKEETDNALDITEEHGVAPIISISVDTDRCEIIVSDNGPGMPPETIKAILNCSVRTSSRSAYVSPTRGQQGNALQTILAMGYAINPSEAGETIIEAGGVPSWNLASWRIVKA
jgi:DNA topoisomerase VI subunit B